MKETRKNKAKYTIGIILIIVALILPLTGCVISTCYQIQAQQEMFGFYSSYRHIWGLYDLWDLTLLGYIPLWIWLEKN